MDNFNKKEAPPKTPGSSRVWLGLFLVLIGVVLFGQKLGLPLPGWLFTWPTLLIVIGIAIGIKDKFQNPGSWIMILIGSVFLADRNVVGLDFHRFIWPLILIIIGLTFILNPRRHKDGRGINFLNHGSPGGENKPRTNLHGDTENQNADKNAEPEFININSVFGGSKRFIVSKNFQGGSITTFMGGAEVNFLQADILNPILIDISSLFGGTKLVVPSNWDIKNEVTAIFGGVEDKRNLSTMMPDKNKVVLLKGTCIFGGIELNSY